MPVEFRLEPTGSSSDTARLAMMYDGSGRRISKALLTKSAATTSWDTVKVTHYTGIGTEVREEFHNGSRERVNVVVKSLQGESRKNKLACSYDRAAAADAGGVNMPEGLGRYKVADASQPADDNASRTFEWYLKNHLGSSMLVYGTQADANPAHSDIGTPLAAYDYRAFGEMVELFPPPTGKVTENFTGKELDDETKLSNHGARLLDPMIGMWITVDPERFFPSPYLYMGNGYNPIKFVDLIGLAPGDPFKSAADAAYDFAKLYNASSIISNQEYNSAIYYDSEKDVYSYTIPTIGKSSSVSATKCISSVPSGMKVITSVHTHAAYDPGFGDGNFIPSRPTGDHYNFVDKTITDKWGVKHRTFGSYKDFLDDPAYLVAPNGTLVEYGPDIDDNGTVIQNTGIAADPTLLYNYNALGE